MPIDDSVLRVKQRNDDKEIKSGEISDECLVVLGRLLKELRQLDVVVVLGALRGALLAIVQPTDDTKHCGLSK